MKCCQYQSEGRQNDVSGVWLKVINHHTDQCNGDKKGYEFDDQLSSVLKIAFARQLLLQWQRLIVIDGQLEQNHVEWPGTDEQIGYHHE